MPVQQPIQCCVDCLLSQSLWLRAAERAVRENPDNLPVASATATPRVGVAASSKLEIFGAILTGKRWKNGRTLQVRHLDGDPDVHARVEAVAKQWERHANITFQFVADAADIRISYSDDNRSWSQVGTDALALSPSDATMHYGWLTPQTPQDEVERTVLHEFGHALGMIHEQSQPLQNIQWDRPAVYRYYAQQGWSQADVDHNVFEKYAAQQTQFTAFDPTSIMQYPIPPGLTLNGFSIGWNRQLSGMDKQFIGQIYPKPAPPGPPQQAAPPVVNTAPVSKTWAQPT